MNGKGISIVPGLPEEIDIRNSPAGSFTSVYLEMKDGKFAGKLSIRETGFSAFNFRQELKKAGSEKDHNEKFREKAEGLEIQNFSYQNVDSLNQPIERKYDFTLTDQDSESPVIYINPLFTSRTKKNPFTSPSRVYPVDFGVPFIENHIFTFVIPEGYKVEELPKNLTLALPGKAGLFNYQISSQDNRITLNMRMSVDKTMFIPDEYKDLKAFFDQIVNKQSEQIVLKKSGRP